MAIREDNEQARAIVEDCQPGRADMYAWCKPIAKFDQADARLTKLLAISEATACWEVVAEIVTN